MKWSIPHHHHNHHLSYHTTSLSSSQPPPVTVIITTTACHCHHHNHHLSLSSSQPPPVTIIIIIIKVHRRNCHCCFRCLEGNWKVLRWRSGERWNGRFISTMLDLQTVLSEEHYQTLLAFAVGAAQRSWWSKTLGKSSPVQQPWSTVPKYARRSSTYVT